MMKMTKMANTHTILGFPVEVGDEQSSPPIGLITISLEAANRLKLLWVLMSEPNDLGMTDLVEKYG
jgi:hypothetical protein